MKDAGPRLRIVQNDWVGINNVESLDSVTKFLVRAVIGSPTFFIKIVVI